ncbi:MAG: hypothetical protein KatS3mg004_1284 [Bryobacteraceae bacterium]|nr:MAG: hypothetical protein KatS3mg004_1284 [Bryobacteraceae bacterium]
MGIRYLIVVATVVGLCILSPIRPVLGLYGYYWFAMMRPDILAWAGPNRYSFLLAAVTLFSNTPRILRNLPLVVLNPVLRTLMLFLLVVTLSVILAVDPSLCTDRYLFFLRVFLMSLVIPLILTTEAELKWFFVVLSGSLGLLAAKYGIYGVLHGGAAFSEGYGGLLSDNNTMALAFAMAVPLCWFSRHLAPWKMARAGFMMVAALALGGVVFTHSRGGILAAGAGLMLITLLEKRKLLTLTLLAAAGAGLAYLVWDSLSSRMSTLKNPETEASARSRIILAQSAPKIWLDYPFFGVGFTETNQQRLIFKYVPPEYAVEYSGKVLHNNWLQILVDSGIFAFLLYVGLIVSVTFRMWRRGRASLRAGDIEGAAIPLAIAVSLAVFIVGSTFLSRTTFDLYYVLICTAAAWTEIHERRRTHAVAGPGSAHLAAASALAEAGAPVPVAGEASPAAAPSRFGFGRLRERRLRAGAPPAAPKG